MKRTSGACSVQLKTHECKRGNDGDYGYEPGIDAHGAAGSITVDNGCERVGYEWVCGERLTDGNSTVLSLDYTGTHRLYTLNFYLDDRIRPRLLR